MSVEVTSRQLGLHLTLDLPGGQTRQALGNDFTLDADWRGSKVRLRLLGAVEAAVKGGVVALVTGRGQRTIPLEPRWDSPVSFVEGEEEPVTLLEETVELEEI